MLGSTFILCILVVLNTDLCRGQEVITTHGRIRGKTINVLGKSLDVFHGIPFAKPPIGSRRFKYPEAADKWEPEVKDATMEKPGCIQPTFLYDYMPADSIKRLPGGTSEDCLYLSIWKPSNASVGSHKAVMLWIYGGAFLYGATSIPQYNGQYLAAVNDVIVVSVNYRLGPLGFAFLGPDTIPGNMGMMDQVEGMKWVKNNIANFGGDPNRITLFGESAGAFSVGYHLLSPLSRNLFNSAILQSGAPVNRVLKGLMNTQEEARDFVKKLAKRIPCSVFSDADAYNCLMKATPSSITTALSNITGATVYPVVDGYFLPDEPITLLERGEYKKANLLIGTTEDELTGFFEFIFNPADKKIYLTGKEFAESDFDMTLSTLTMFPDKGRREAMKIFYESEQNPPVDYINILNYAGSDIFYKCPTLELSSFYAKSNNVSLYSFNYRMSNIPYPDWMGVPHAFDLEPVFGMPLNDSLSYNDIDKEMSRNMMKYWTNFAKSGDPNIPESTPMNWPRFNNQDLTYLNLAVGSDLAVKHGYRRHQCAFVFDILPMIPKDKDTDMRTTTWPEVVCPSSGTGSRSDCVAILLGLLAALLWIRN